MLKFIQKITSLAPHPFIFKK